MLRLPLTLAAAALFAVSASAQLRKPGTPASARHDLPTEIPVVLLEAPDHAALLAAEPENEPGPFRYGHLIGTALSLEDAGRWDQTADGALVWRIELVSPGAYSVGILFDRFELPAGGRLFLYDRNRARVLGAYTEANNNPNGSLAIQPLRGDHVVVEYVQPPEVTGIPQLRIGELVHDYKDILQHVARNRSTGGGIAAMPCKIDINCPEAENHQDVKRAVVEVFMGGGQCSASILNNSAEDGTPFLFSANHCGGMTNVVAIFDYERTGCETGASSQAKSLSGAVLVERSIPYDSQLYRLNGTPPANYFPFYAGWNVTGSADGPTVGISHPQGNPKKFQMDDQNPAQGPTNWTVVNDIGLIQGGSSGSPLFDANKRVIGTLSTGAQSCGADFANYGRLDRFWATKDLDVHLDPMGWGLGEIDGYDPFSAYVIPYNGSGANPEILSALNAPVLGTTWTVEVDTSGHPGATTTIYSGYIAPASTVISVGEILVSPPRLFKDGAAVAGGLSQHSFAIPNDASLSGLVLYTQAFLFGGPTTATNGLKAIVN